MCCHGRTAEAMRDGGHGALTVSLSGANEAAVANSHGPASNADISGARTLEPRFLDWRGGRFINIKSLR